MALKLFLNIIDSKIYESKEVSSQKTQRHIWIVNSNKTLEAIRHSKIRTPS